MWDDLKFYSAGTTDGLFYSLTGDAGNQILTIEFLQVGRYNSTGLVNFQVKLFEQDSTIQFVYGDLTEATGWSVNSTTSIGMNATANKTAKFISVTPNNVSGATVSSEIENDEILPEDLILIASGTTYIFTPPEIIDEFDIAITNINSPKSGFLTVSDSVKITIENPGLEITEGLTLSYEIFDINTGTQIGQTILEDYNNYPLQNLSVVQYTFTNTADLSENGSYSITVTLNIEEEDINMENNQISKEVFGLILDEIIYDNGPIITRYGLGFNNADVSEVQTVLGMYNYAYNTFWEIGYRNADEFIIPENEEWIIKGIGFYNYQTGTDTISTINYLDFRIFNGSPDETETDTLFDFYDQNILSGSKWTGGLSSLRF